LLVSRNITSASPRLQQPSHRAGPRDQPDLAAGQQHHRAVAHPAGQVHGGERLAGARPPVEQQPAAQVAAGRQHAVAMRGEGDSVALDPFEHAVGEHDVLSRDLGERMELRALLEALRAHPDQPIVILTDSQYAIDCLTTWLPGWRRNGWRTSARRPVKHQPIIEAIAVVLDRRPVRLVKVPGHAGHPLYERDVRLAAAAAALAARAAQ
jgi:ribonuclease HI